MWHHTHVYIHVLTLLVEQLEYQYYTHTLVYTHEMQSNVLALLVPRPLNKVPSRSQYM